MLNQVRQLLESEGFETKVISCYRLAVLTDSDRISTLKTIAELVQGEYDSTPISKSSIGVVRKGDLFIFAKPKSRQGNMSAGIENELLLFSKLTHAIEMGVQKILFSSPDERYFLVENPREVHLVGRSTKDRKKSDIIIVDRDGREFPISIKKENAEIWESADSYWGAKAKHILDSHPELVTKNEDIFSVSPNIAIKASVKETKDVVFGSDILGDGCIVRKTFSFNSFIVGEGMIEVKCEEIISEVSQVEDDCYFLIRNDRTRNSIEGYPGIRAIAVTKSRLTSPMLLL